MTRSGPSPADRALRMLARHQRLAVAAFTGLAVMLGLEVVRPPSPPVVQVVMAARDLSPGVALTTGDLRAVGVPPDLVPAGALRSVGAALGRLTSGPVRRGEPLTDVRLLTPGLLDRLGAGLLAVPVRIGEASSLRLLRPGDRVDVLAVPDDMAGAGAAPTDSAVRVAAAVTVLAVPQPAEGEIGDGALLVVAATEETARSLVAAAAGSRLAVVLRPPS